MRGTIYTTTVEGKTYTYWCDYIYRGTFAENEDGEVKPIKGNGYIIKDLTVRKAIANKFGHKTFRK